MKNKLFGIFKLLATFTVLLVVAATLGNESQAIVQAKKPIKLSATKKMAIKSTKDIASLDQALKAGVPVVVKLGSDKCLPCRMMNPVIKELAVEQDGQAVFLSLDVYKNRELAKQSGVRVIPTILFYDKHGKPKAKSEGGMTKKQLLKAVKELKLNK